MTSNRKVRRMKKGMMPYLFLLPRDLWGWTILRTFLRTVSFTGL